MRKGRTTLLAAVFVIRAGGGSTSPFWIAWRHAVSLYDALLCVQTYEGLLLGALTRAHRSDTGSRLIFGGMC